MTQDEHKAKSDNELIAEFMGWRIQGEPEYIAPYEVWVSETGAMMWPRTDPQGHKYTEKFEFNTSWDWLMPVVEKLLNELNLITSPRDLYEYANFQSGRVERKLWDCLYKRCTLSEVSSEVAEVIKWYNEQKLLESIPKGE